MRFAARRDPRLDPRITPEQWGASRRVYWIRLVTLVLILVLGTGLAWFYYQQSLDKTRDLQPEQVVEQAGLFLAKAEAYRFLAQLTGESGDGYFPEASMHGEYQREPLLLHLAGEAGSGENKVPLEYYLNGADLYVKNPRSGTWIRVADAELDELYAFQPDNLAAPLVTGLRSAEEIRREQLVGGEAILYSLELDPKVMQVQPSVAENERVEYRLWVYTRTLRPAQFQISMRRESEDELAKPSLRFQYLITWDFSPTEPLVLPDEVTSQTNGE